jgi:hypothetical protein
LCVRACVCVCVCMYVCMYVRGMYVYPAWIRSQVGRLVVVTDVGFGF